VGGAKKDYATTQMETQKKIRTMENRLSKQNNKYNTTLTRNAQLREDIEKLRNERSIFNGLYVRMDEELEKLRHQKAELTEQATVAYDQRDEANSKCTALKDKNDKDRIQFEMETRDLQRVIHHDNRLREFMNTKANERLEWRRQEEERRKMHGSAGEIARKQQSQQIHTYEEAFKRIREITQKDDLDLIVNEFVKHEDENFAFFQYVSELNNQVETLYEEIEQIREEIRKYRAEETALESERQHILKGLEIEMAHKKEEADKAESRLTEVNKILDQLRTGVKSLFTKIGCDDSVILDMLGGDSDVTDRNLMLYMGSVEQRTNELLAVEYYIQTKKYLEEEQQEQPEHGMTLGIGFDLNIHRESTVVPPAIGDDLDNSDEDNVELELRPLSQNELMSRVFRDIKKREAGPGHKQHGRKH
jgi:coiled-coil domain-containing protein 63/114